MVEPDDEEPSAAPPRGGHRVRAPKAAELIARQLRGKIVRGELDAGDALPSEMTLMEQFGVSRPTLREAFRVLETENMISVRRGAHGGAQVATPDVSVAARHVGILLQIQGTTVEDVNQARMVTEPACARLLARGRTEHDLAELRSVASELGAVVRAGPDQVTDPATWSDLTYRFHEVLVRRCGNNTLAVQGAVLQDIVATHLDVGVAKGFDRALPNRFGKLLRSYNRLIELVEQHDADGAEQHWRNHLEAAAKSMSRRVPANQRLIDLFA